MFFFTNWRRSRIRSRPPPAEWAEILCRSVPYFRLLPEQDRTELLGHTQVLIREKHFEGCGGLELTEEMRLIIAAQACILVLHRKTDYFPKVQSIVVYPYAYVARRVETDESGLVHEEDEIREGESWERGTVVLSWDEIARHSRGAGRGRNIILHEFAHQLDQELGGAAGVPLPPERAQRADWARVLGEEYDRLQEAVERGRRTFLDPYAATDPAEFFAVVTETFFERPVDLRRRHPELYGQLKAFYRQDPAGLFEKAAKAAGKAD